MKNYNQINKSTIKKREEMTDQEKIKNALNFIKQIKKVSIKNKSTNELIPQKKDTYREPVE
ncbi:hypothetical protein KAS79_02945 [Candidatus Parcubacteria bacterium]|nr:hypothetical protein [Candidatus Parcubacteria bacterium]